MISQLATIHNTFFHFHYFMVGKNPTLTTSMVKDAIRITCKNALNDNFGFSKDFTLEELRKLDPIFGLIKSPYGGLGYID